MLELDTVTRMFGITDYEKWLETPLFNCPFVDQNAYHQLVHMKCFAVTIMNSCVMNILVVHKIQNFLICILAACMLVTLLSPHLIWKLIPMTFLGLAFFVPTIRGGINFRYGAFYAYCMICCMEVQGFEYLFDLYLVVCYVIESFYATYSKRMYNALSATVCEFFIWTIPCSLEFRVSVTFVYLAVEAYNYPQIWMLSSYYVGLGLYMFANRVLGYDFEAQYDEFKLALDLLIEFFITNASLTITPEKKTLYKAP